MVTEITPQDLGSSLSVLKYLLAFAEANSETASKNKITELISEYSEIMQEPAAADKAILPYNRRDAYSILEYLKVQAEQLSDGRWTDFSDADIGTVFLKLLSYLADMNNFQVDKVVSELYMNTCVERASALALCSLIGYEPRHYQSAFCTINLENKQDKDIENGTVIPAYSVFTDTTNTIKYCNLKSNNFYNNKATLEVYEGNLKTLSFSLGDITTLGRIILPDYYIGTNTISLSINGLDYRKVDDVRFESGDLIFSVHMSTEQYLYIQLPAYWPDLVTQNSVIQVKYLISNGINGRIGKNMLTKISELSGIDNSSIRIVSNTASEGGYDPETVDEMRTNVPKQARTMNTIVTINDFEEVGLNIDSIADISALDYNNPASGLIQPDDYYKVHLYVLPDAEQYDATDSDLVKYRNTIIKDRNDWNVSDMEKVADNLDIISYLSVPVSNTITLDNAAISYLIDDIIPSVDTGVESTSYLIEKVADAESVTDRLACSISKSGDNYLVKLCPTWKSFVTSNQKFNIYYKKDQVLTDKGQKLREYIDERRLTSLNVTYHELEIVQPKIIIDVYMDKYDIRFKDTDIRVKDFILDRFSRKNMKIGQPLFASVIGSDILHEFDYIRYCEVRDPEELIEVTPKGFIDIIPNKIQNGALTDMLIVNVHDYQNREI